MDFLLTFLPMVIYILIIAILVIGIIFGIKAIKTLNKVDKIVDDVNEKMESLDSVLNIIDFASEKIVSISDKVVDVVWGLISKLFTRKKNKKIEEEEDYE